MPARDALRRLAEGPDHRTAVATAAAATGDVERAASFVSRGGRYRLDRAIVAAEREGDEAAARVGRAARDALSVQFRPARGTVLGGDGESRAE